MWKTCFAAPSMWETPDTGGDSPLDDRSDEGVVDLTDYKELAKYDAQLAFEQMKQKALHGNRDISAAEFEEMSAKKDKNFVPNFVPSIEQLGDAVGNKFAGKNFLINSGLGNPAWWCKNPAHPPTDPLPKNSHPFVQLAYNARHITVHLEDKGTVSKPTKIVLWDADFGKVASVKEITSTMMPDGGLKPQMTLICPPPGESHRYEMVVNGQDHRTKPPKNRNRGLDENVMFSGEILAPGSREAQRRPPDGTGDTAKGAGRILPAKLRKLPFVEGSMSPLIPLTILPAPLVHVHSCTQLPRSSTGSLASLQRMKKAAAFL